MKSNLIVSVAICLLVTAPDVRAEILFESGTLGPTGISYADLGGTVPGTNVNSSVFTGVRFELTRPVVATQVGGHFVEESTGTFFGAIVALEDANDFPDSSNLSTPDVLGRATLTFPSPSGEVFGDILLPLNSGWYALVFGSGLFGSAGSGGAIRNGSDIGDPTYIAYGPNLQWFNLDALALPFDNHRFVVEGFFVPEPGILSLIVPLLFACLRIRQQRVE